MNVHLFKKRKKKAFTLVELLVVIGIIGTLASGTYIAINPTKTIIDTLDASSTRGAKAINDSVLGYQIDFSGDLPGDQTIPTTEEEAIDICSHEATNTGSCLTLKNDLVPDYIAAIPQDTRESNPDLSGYKIWKHPFSGPKIVQVYVGQGPSGSAEPEPSSSPMPTGAVLAFNSADCPDGWDVFSALQGRSILGAGSGNDDADGGDLTARSRGNAGGTEYTMGIPVDDATGTISAPDPDTYLAANSQTSFIEYTVSTAFAGVAADSNMPPYYALTYCKKNSSDDLVMSNAVSASIDNSCPAEWAEASEVNGRVIVGVGSGNSDDFSVALTARALGESGGREFTTGIPASNQAGPLSTPAANRVIARSNGAMYYFGSANTTVAGEKTDSNMPPFVSLTMCDYAEEEISSIPSGLVVSFDLASCPSGWSEYTDGAGRMIVGKGSGNTDADSNALTARLLNDTGGRELTTGIPASTLTANAPVPISSTVLGAYTNRYSAGPSTLSLSPGVGNNDNLNPFYTLLWCEKS